MRVFFHPANFGVAANAASIRMKASLPLRAFDTVDDLRQELDATTDNVGNMVHNEAVAKSFEVNRLRSCMAPLYHFYVNESKSDKKLFQKNMESSFDAVVLSLANLIAPPLPGREAAQQKHMELLCEILDALPIPFYMFGLGMQDAIDDIDKLVPGMVELLKLLNDKAAMFGVRGAQTEAFMHSNGFTNAKALGCPSLYIYPDNVLSLQTPDVRKGASALTAGHLWLRNIFGYQPERTEFLRNLASTYQSDYVFQNDIYSYHELNAIRGFYDDSNGLVDKHVMEDYLTAHGVAPIPFKDYWHFRDARSWRMLAEKTDFYFGDRFHGGVVSLQVGKPALFVYKDLRVEELTAHVGAPSISFDDLEGQDLTEVVAHAFSKPKLEQFKDTYTERAKEYYDTCTQAGMKPLDEVRSRSVRREGLQHDWQQPLIDAAIGGAGGKALPVRTQAALNIVSQDQDNHRSGELLIRALVADTMHKGLDAVSDLMTEQKNEEFAWRDAEYFFRLAYFLSENQQYVNALKFADVYYSKIYKRKGQLTELYVSIQIELGNFEAAEAALLRRADDEGYEATFALLLAKVSILSGKLEEGLERLKLVRGMSGSDGLEDRIAVLEEMHAELST